ncbi:hypothetical protein OPV22_022097 [Ensete ventricosum]|uniref:UspA domain-containing protein n=1 Tax=Ensete ventricosum TaxID=4639 RepID=A0AAV8PBS2_ENSVE|nr:hypothetical protein OPV22_022097 [Ensete ventricosum]
MSAAVAQAAIQPSSPRFFLSSVAAACPSPGSHRRIAIAVDLSDESAYAVKWAVQNYLRPGDAVILLNVRPTSVLYGADWGAIDVSVSAADAAKTEDAGSEESQRKLEDDFHALTTAKAQDLAQPLVQAQIPFKIHIVNDHDMKERLCLEVERLGLSAVIMGSRGFGAARRTNKGRLGSVSDYCVHHCVCPVVVVRMRNCNRCQKRMSSMMHPMSKKIDKRMGFGVVLLNQECCSQVSKGETYETT